MAAYDVVLLEEVKTALSIDGTDEDENLARLISSTTLAVERKLGTQFLIRQLVEYHEGGCKRLYPQRTPIVSVVSIVDPKGTTILATQYAIRQQRWIEHWGHFDVAFTAAGQPTDWSLTYTAGWFASLSVVSPDVKAEIIRAVGAQREAPAPGVTSTSVGDLSVGYGAGTVPSPAVDAAAACLFSYQGVLL